MSNQHVEHSFGEDAICVEEELGWSQGRRVRPRTTKLCTSAGKPSQAKPWKSLGLTGLRRHREPPSFTLLTFFQPQSIASIAKCSFLGLNKSRGSVISPPLSAIPDAHSALGRSFCPQTTSFQLRTHPGSTLCQLEPSEISMPDKVVSIRRHGSRPQPEMDDLLHSSVPCVSAGPCIPSGTAVRNPFIHFRRLSLCGSADGVNWTVRSSVSCRELDRSQQLSRHCSPPRRSSHLF